MTIKEIFEKYKNITVYGMSTNPSKPANHVPVFFIEKGYIVIPVNPVADEIAGQKVYKNLIDIPVDIEILNVFRPSDKVLAIVEEAVARKNQKNDIKLIWLQEGIINNEAKELAEANGIEFIQDKCMFKEYRKLF